jgi:MFS family permease
MQDAQPDSADSTTLRDLSATQWKSGFAAWSGWLFDGLDMHLYVLVAAPFVAELLRVENSADPSVSYYSSWIQAAFLVGWALGGGAFGYLADRLGRSRTLSLTILTYACFTGLSYFAQEWWHLLIFRFLAALGIGGEWAVGASMISETWPKRWRPWMAAVLQSGVNLGIMLAGLANFLLAEYPHRTIFLVGVLPALLVLWIRKAVPEPEEWRWAQKAGLSSGVRFTDLFRGEIRRTTVLSMTLCALALTAHWAFLFWHLQHLRGVPEYRNLSPEVKSQLVSQAVWFVMLSSIAGNFLAAAIARVMTFRVAIMLLCCAYSAAMSATYATPVSAQWLWVGFVAIGLSQGVFALFTMYLPPLFPTSLRTSGAGFCFNIGRIAAAIGTIVFGLVSKVGDHQQALFYAGLLFLPAAILAWMLPKEIRSDPVLSHLATPSSTISYDQALKGTQ